MAGDGIVFLVVLAVSFGSGLLLYTLVRGEGNGGEEMDRETAERLARRDTDERD